jgi:protein tyrosine/serine phosphatase
LAGTAAFAATSAASMTAADDSAGEATYPELPNFHRVDEHLYRGAQPAEGGIARLKSLGVRTIVNLRGETSLVTLEAREAQEAGLRYFSVPMRGLGRPTDEQLKRILGLIDQSDNWPVFVHCKAGQDRTGLVVACQRIARAGWTAERAIHEAMDLGMMKIEFAMRSFIRDFETATRRPAERASGEQASAGSGAQPRASSLEH